MDQKNVSANLISYLQPTSPVSEAYRTLRANIHYSSVDKPIKTVVVTSATTKDGKTVTASNLAVSMANTGSNVLLIDADLRKPAIHKQFRINNSKGLTDLLVGEASFKQTLHTLEDVPGLFVLTCGAIPPNPSELLASNKIKDFIKSISDMFDVIIIDTPPVGFLSDGIVLSSEADGVLLVVAAKQTRVNYAQYATEALRRVNANIIGVVMTKVRNRKKSYYYDYK